LEPKTRRLYYSAAWQVLEERVGGNPVAQYIWSPRYVDSLVLRDRDTDGDGSLNQRHYVQQDANFNVTSISDATGAAVERYHYDPYGSVTVLHPGGSPLVGNESAYSWNHLHQGGRHDGDTGLYHFRNREYDAELGRWMQQDPARYIDGATLYAALASSPVSQLDPLGLQVTVTVGQVGGTPNPNAHYAEATPAAPVPFSGGKGYHAEWTYTDGPYWPGYGPVPKNWTSSYYPDGLCVMPPPSNPGDGALSPLDAALEGAWDGALAWANGVIPFGDPIPDSWFYDAKDPNLAVSEFMGEISRDAWLAALGARLARGSPAGEQEPGIIKRLAEGAKRDKKGLSEAGRALEKHGSRKGSVFPPATGNASAKSQQGQKILREILESRQQQIRPNRFGGQDIFDMSSGRGVRYDGSGKMMGFLEP
jgi:RHS repeat-associated protein